ncbi:MAG: hypothetical protein HYT62_04445 [Candidatus Yanofskybacteria bacterium]|nr:hypothetical protein [Candidatus Yanofskybacteria bacterium]
MFRLQIKNIILVVFPLCIIFFLIAADKGVLNFGKNNISEGDTQLSQYHDNSSGYIEDDLGIYGDALPSASPTPSLSISGPLYSATPTRSVSASVSRHNKSREFGVWVWTPPDQLSNDQMREIIKQVSESNFNVIYLTIDSYLEINSLPDSHDKNVRKSSYTNSLASFISLAKDKNIAVDAEAGWRDWAEPAGRFKAYAIFDYVEEYNRAKPNQRLRGLQYDVEVYLLSNYDDDKISVLSNFVELVDTLSEKNRGKLLRLSFVIPHFYDSLQGWTPAIDFNGETNFVFNQILRSLDKLDQASVILMSYRNFAEGDNGTIQISRQEMIDASRGYRTKVIVAQEVGDVDPDYVTFFNTSEKYLFDEIEKVELKFSEFTGFGGISIHYLDPFLDLRNQ